MGLLAKLLNPVGAIFLFVFGWLGRRIDKLLPPTFGLIVAVLFGLFVLSLSSAIFYGIRNEAAVAVGLTEEAQVTRTDGAIDAISRSKAKSKNKVEQDLIVSYVADGARHSFDETVSVNKGDQHQAGEFVTVYLREGKAPTIREPNERVVDIVLFGGSLIVSLLALWWALRYFRHRKRIFVAARGTAQLRFGRSDTWGTGNVAKPAATRGAPRPAPSLAGSVSTPPPSPVLRGNTRPMTTAERMKADAERAKQMARK